jgi:two-component system, OmpR family, response regulator
MEKIFLVEDDNNFGSVLKAYLEVNDFYVVWVIDGKNAIKEFRAEQFNLCILDVMLPNIDGFTLAKEIKLINANIPLIFLTAKSMKADMVQGFKIGADDYITKPFDSEVLLYKIKAILHRNQLSHLKPEIVKEFQIGYYRFNYELRTISYQSTFQKLSPKEAELLKMLCEKKNNVLTREEALLTIWGDDTYFTTRSMDVFITKLRKYLKEDPTIEIENIHGSGFRLRN